ncbi:tRNA dimethylallyltransferase 9 [Zea mays]|uniref:tRNA dimethylallyltransferase n=1 Tax=Zea mays TaxID=4577 RepID=A0A3L6E5X9_MAIZE|nr:tRNA dimethylallyltransferase 9 [Zea mays]
MRPQQLGVMRRAIWRSWPILCSQSQHRLLSSFCASTKIATMAASSLPPPTHHKKKDTVIVISGPTGAGKSRLALEVARRLGGEIISADSVQVYRGLDVGSAKPSAAEMSLVPHHLIDILDTSDDYSAGAFFRDARRATQDVLDRGCVPVIAGGTGLYLRWYIYGKPNVPQSSMESTSAVWSELADFRENGQWEEAVELVVQAGDPRARNLSVNNWNRLSRSLEIIRSSGSPPSAFALPYDAFCEQHDTDLTEAPSSAGNYEAREMEYDFFCIFLASPRIELYRSIDLRCEEMLVDTGGLLSEASWLLDIGLQPRMNSASSAIGYKQAMEYLLHCRQNGGESTPQEFLDFLAKFQRTSRNFAKRQLTWFRNEKIYHWVDGSKPFEALVQFVCDAYHGCSARMVPESLEMKRENCVLKSRDLKTYRSMNRVFLGGDDCSHVLNWIRRTQSK